LNMKLKKTNIILSCFVLLVLLVPLNNISAMEIKDQLNRKIHLPKQIKKIVSLAPSITEIIYALGVEDLLVGVTQYSDYPAAASSLPKVGSYVHLDLERIIALKPDLCIATRDGNPLTTIERLEIMKIPVYAVDPRNLETIIQTILELGRLLKAEKKADFLAANMRSRILKIKNIISCTQHRTRLFFQIGISPIVSAGSPTFINELIELAGGENLARGPAAYPRFSKEKVISLAPEVIIITSMARSTVFEKVKAEWNRWPDLPAVKQQRIYLEDSNLFDRPTPRLVDGLELLAKLLHPELFENIK